MRTRTWRLVDLIIAVLVMIGTGLLLQTADANGPTVKLTWTATGDDGDQGTAAGYDLRFSRNPITAATWPDCIAIDSLPAPLPAGQVMQTTYTLPGDGLYFFAIKAYDDAGNYSPLSNVVGYQVDQTAPGQIIDLTAQPQP